MYLAEVHVHVYLSMLYKRLTSPFLYRFLTYIGDLCVCQGQAIQKVQMMVCNMVLQDSNADVPMKITYMYMYIHLYIARSRSTGAFCYSVCGTPLEFY